MTKLRSKMRLYSTANERLYLNAPELTRFLAVAEEAAPDIRRFALTLVYTGMRMSEARSLRHHHIQLVPRIISVNTLKRREVGVIRELPMPRPLVTALKALPTPDDSYDFIWGDQYQPVQRITAYRWIKALMAEAQISGPKACPHGLRHTFGTRAILAGVPLHILQRWMGHAAMETTAIYATVLGRDQLKMADGMW